MSVETFTAHVESVTHLTQDVCELDLRLIEPKAIAFKPGQFIFFEMPHPQTGRLMTRAYSIASPPRRHHPTVQPRAGRSRFRLSIRSQGGG